MIVCLIPLFLANILGVRANIIGLIEGLTVRLADRTGKGIRNSPRDALIVDSIDETQWGLAFGLHRAGDTAGAALGLLIAFVYCC